MYSIVNKLNMTNQIELSKVEEKLSKPKAKLLFDSGDITRVKVGTFEEFAYIMSKIGHQPKLQKKQLFFPPPSFT